PESAPGQNDGINRLHVFGRTFHTRHVYYYRRLENNTQWTHWEKVSVDIEGDHLIPVVWNRRLHIFWPILTEKAVEATRGSNNTPPDKYFEIKLAWSEYKNGKWSAKQMMSEGESLTSRPDPSLLTIFTAPAGENAVFIGKYLSCLRKLHHVIAPKEGFEAQLRAPRVPITVGMSALGMTRQIGDGHLQRIIEPCHVPGLQCLDNPA